MTAVRERGGLGVGKATADFIAESIGSRPVQTASWSSSLTGLWVFGMLSRSYNADRVLEAVPIVRDGVNIGFYSSVYDTTLFRAAIDKSEARESRPAGRARRSHAQNRIAMRGVMIPRL